MIDNQKLAEKIISELNHCTAILNETILQVKDNCKEEEFLEYRKSAGFVMGCILTELLNPLYKKHPDLVPSELRGAV